jgi:hypothetical protein
MSDARVLRVKQGQWTKGGQASSRQTQAPEEPQDKQQQPTERVHLGLVGKNPDPNMWSVPEQGGSGGGLDGGQDGREWMESHDERGHGMERGRRCQKSSRAKSEMPSYRVPTYSSLGELK